jgi:hypothetical protein
MGQPQRDETCEGYGVTFTDFLVPPVGLEPTTLD